MKKFFPSIIYTIVFSQRFLMKIYTTLDICFLYFLNCARAVMKKYGSRIHCRKLFNQYCSEYSEKDKFSLLFKFIQYVERQIVLFDAIEDAAFPEINNLDGIGTLRGIKELVESLDKKNDLKKFLTKAKVRPVLTAHPTQFYPGSVLGIITDLTFSVKKMTYKK